MRMIYLECRAGASGDMILGALAGLLDDPHDFQKMIDDTGIPHVVTTITKGESNGIGGNKVHISVDGVEEGLEHHPGHHHEHRTLSDVRRIISGLNVSDRVKADADAIYAMIAEAESTIHGKPVDLVHFHEVGALDAVADIVGACLLFEKLSPEKVVVSPIRTGCGETHCAHGILPVPAPATALILRGMPVYAGDEEGEFCTPTGAAIIKHFATDFGAMPAMVFDSIGIGLGNRRFRIANILRAYLGQTGDVLPTIKEICCNVDDMTSEDIGVMPDVLLENGALDVFIKPCIMKKGRPGFELTCLCRPEDLDRMAKLILSNTSTIGLRVHDCERYAMRSHFENVETEYGNVRMKVSEGFGFTKHKPEYEDIKRISEENGMPITEIRNAAERQYRP